MLRICFSTCAAATLLLLPPATQAQTPAPSPAQTSAASSSAPSLQQTPPAGFIGGFLARVSATQAEQPHWVTPLATVTPRLEQEIRSDFLSQPQTNGTRLWNFGAGRGLEIIPTRHIELLFNVPPYLQHNSKAKDGFGDVPFLLKYRVYARNEEHGNSIFTIFVGGSIPTGSYVNGSRNGTVSPTIAGGKGYGKFDVQSTAGVTLPVRNGNGLGRPIAWNTAVQFHQDAHWWPEIEDNYTYNYGGPAASNGRISNYITPGVVSRWRLHNRIGVTLGAGFQIATSQYHTFNHGVITSARMPF